MTKYKLNFKRTSNRYSKHDLLLNIEKVWDYLGKQPIINDMEMYPSEIHWGTYFNQFGSWKKALTEFVKYKNNGEIIDFKESSFRQKRKSLTNSLRYDVMRKDNFKCRLCGKSPANDIKIRLEIDHILPVSKGGTNDLNNLQTLCQFCNSGKNNK